MEKSELRNERKMMNMERFEFLFYIDENGQVCSIHFDDRDDYWINTHPMDVWYNLSDGNSGTVN